VIGRSRTISIRMENQDVLIATHIGTWQRNVKDQRKNETQGNTTNVIK